MEWSPKADKQGAGGGVGAAYGWFSWALWNLYFRKYTISLLNYYNSSKYIIFGFELTKNRPNLQQMLWVYFSLQHYWRKFDSFHLKMTLFSGHLGISHQRWKLPLIDLSFSCKLPSPFENHVMKARRSY